MDEQNMVAKFAFAKIKCILFVFLSSHLMSFDVTNVLVFATQKHQKKDTRSASTEPSSNDGSYQYVFCPWAPVVNPVLDSHLRHGYSTRTQAITTNHPQLLPINFVA